MKSVGDFISGRPPPVFLIPTELDESLCAGRAGQTRAALWLPCGCPGRQWVQEQHGLVVPPFPWVPDSDPTDSDTDTKQPRGAGAGGEVGAEKLGKPSEVEAERMRLRAGFLAPFRRPHLPQAQEETLPLHCLGNNERPEGRVWTREPQIPLGSSRKPQSYSLAFSFKS